MDIMMPHLDGFSAVKEIKKIKDIPVIMLSARGEEYDKLFAFEIGADDYVTKPFSIKLLLARIKANIRRYSGEVVETVVPVSSDEDKIVIRALEIDNKNFRVTKNGNEIELSNKEYELLYFLASSPNQVFTREQLLDQIWGYEYVGDTRTVDVHIKRLREKIRDHEKWAISTIWGIGYKFEVK